MSGDLRMPVSPLDPPRTCGRSGTLGRSPRRVLSPGAATPGSRLIVIGNAQLIHTTAAHPRDTTQRGELGARPRTGQTVFGPDARKHATTCGRNTPIPLTAAPAEPDRGDTRPCGRVLSTINPAGKDHQPSWESKAGQGI